MFYERFTSISLEMPVYQRVKVISKPRRIIFDFFPYLDSDPQSFAAVVAFAAVSVVVQSSL